MRKTEAALLALIILFSLLGACAKSDVAEDGGSLRIIGTVFPYCDFAAAIAPDAEIKQLLPPGADCHSYEPTAADIAAVEKCDLLLRTGGEGEEWVDSLLGAAQGGFTVLELSQSVSLMQHEDGDWDEHIWTSPENAKLICAAIAEQITALCPGQAEETEKNLKAYTQQLDALSADIRETVASSSHNTLLFGDRFPFLYLARDYGLSYLAAFPGCGEDTEPDARSLAAITEEAKKQSSPVILHIELTSTRIADTLADETGARVMQLHSCHNIAKEDSGETYLSLMRGNIEVLKAALG